MMAFDFDGNVSIWATSKHQQTFQKEGPEVLKQKQTDGVALGQVRSQHLQDMLRGLENTIRMLLLRVFVE